MFSKLHAMMFTCLAVGIVVAACSSDGTQTPTSDIPARHIGDTNGNPGATPNVDAHDNAGANRHQGCDADPEYTSIKATPVYPITTATAVPTPRTGAPHDPP